MLQTDRVDRQLAYLAGFKPKEATVKTATCAKAATYSVECATQSTAYATTAYATTAYATTADAATEASPKSLTLTSSASANSSQATRTGANSWEPTATQYPTAIASARLCQHMHGAKGGWQAKIEWRGAAIFEIDHSQLRRLRYEPHLNRVTSHGFEKIDRCG
jgi:hypothetical protein